MTREMAGVDAAASTIVVLQRDSFIAGRIGRRDTMIAAVATMMVAMGVLAAWPDLPGLLIGRLITGVRLHAAEASSCDHYLPEILMSASGPPTTAPVVTGQPPAQPSSRHLGYRDRSQARRGQLLVCVAGACTQDSQP
ncbi:MAG TPA: hypothetical protein VHZ03_02215 [Trebonia sp.]|nr:hypothetical protein [Trebonia sp.]